MTSDLPKPYSAHLHLTESPIAEPCHKIFFMYLHGSCCLDLNILYRGRTRGSAEGGRGGEGGKFTGDGIDEGWGVGVDRQGAIAALLAHCEHAVLVWQTTLAAAVEIVYPCSHNWLFFYCFYGILLAQC